MSPEEERLIYKLLEDRISELHKEVFGDVEREIPLTDPLLEVLTQRWRDYIQNLDISFISKDLSFHSIPGRFRVPNPFYVDQEEFKIMDMSIETAIKILTLGLP